LSRPDAKLFGGTGIAATVATIEAESGRGTVYATVQFVGSADVGDRIECHVEEVARGRRTSQMRMTATVDGRLVLVAFGGTADARPSGLDAQLGSMPDVPGPEDTTPWNPGNRIPILKNAPSWLLIADVREMVKPRHAVWARMRDARQTRATLGFLADMVPSAVVRAAGRWGGGTSLDNSMRFGPAPDTEWVLIDYDPYLAHHGYAHGGARVWSEDGVLLGVASQTASVILIGNA